jgi:hypothetical protein
MQLLEYGCYIPFTHLCLHRPPYIINTPTTPATTPIPIPNSTFPALPVSSGGSPGPLGVGPPTDVTTLVVVVGVSLALALSLVIVGLAVAFPAPFFSRILSTRCAASS